MTGSRKLTVFFDDPFWAAIAEEQDETGYRAARHVFGSEPTQPQIEELVLCGWKRLRFTSVEETEFVAETQVGFKRAQKRAKREMKNSATRGTKAQQALQAQYEENKQERMHARSLAKQQKKDEAYALRRKKRKSKARGN